MISDKPEFWGAKDEKTAHDSDVIVSAKLAKPVVFNL